MQIQKKINLPSVLTEDTWFYKDRPKDQERLKPLLGKYYISYSSVDSFLNYKEDFIKQKIVGIKLPEGIYGEFGSYCGYALENGSFPEENPHGFTGQENMNLEELRGEGAEYERMIIIDRGEYFIIGFIDYLVKYEDGVHVRDQKTGGKGKESKYQSEDYIQVPLYAHALELEGLKVSKADVWFIRRENSHIKPPLKIGNEQFSIPIRYDKKIAEKALNKVEESVKGISDLYTTYQKYFN